MKKISTSDKTSGETLELAKNILGTSGNENIRGCHIEYFESKVLELKENTTHYITLAPNFYAWLCLMAEHMFWIIRDYCFTRKELNATYLDVPYNILVEQFCEMCRQSGSCSDNELTEIYDIVDRILLLRHAVVHKGFPNIIPATFTEERIKPKYAGNKERIAYNLEEAIQVVSWYSNPELFDDIKKEFDRILDLVRRTPGVEVQFPGFSVSCGPRDEDSP